MAKLPSFDHCKQACFTAPTALEYFIRRYTPPNTEREFRIYLSKMLDEDRYQHGVTRHRDIFDAVVKEIKRAENKHSWPKDIRDQVLVINEEMGEVNRAVVQYRLEGGNIEEIRTELIQTIATCVRMLKNLK